MAEAMLNRWGATGYEAFSAGTEATPIRPETVRVMDELAIDISGHRSKMIAEFADQAFDLFVTVCDDARDSCPVLPGARQVAHWSIEDPSLAEGSTRRRLSAFRAARDHLEAKVRALVETGEPGS